MSTHLLGEDLLLVVAGELSGPDLIHASEHIHSCAQCRERAAHSLTARGSALAGTFHEELEQTIALVETGRAPIRETLSRLQAMELALFVAGQALGRDSANLDRQRARTLFWQAWLLMLNGSLSSSRKAVTRAREIFTRLGDEIEVARTLVADSLALGQLCETAGAISAAREAGAIFLRHDEQRRVRVARSTEAAALVIADRYAEAAVIYRELLALVPPDDPDRLHWLNNLAMCLLELGELEEAEEIELGVLASPFLTPEMSLGARWVCAGVWARRGRVVDALELLRFVKADARTQERQYHEKLASYTMADLLSALNRPQEAAAMAREAISYFTEENVPNYARRAIALLREALLLDSTDIFGELENVRREFPELFPSALILPSFPSRQIS